MDLFIEEKDRRSGMCIILDKLSNRLVVGDFVKKLQGGHMQVTKEFVSNFTGFNSKVGVLELIIYLEVISVVIQIPKETIL